MQTSNKIVIASDHAGFHMKEAIKKYLDKQEYDYEDFGTTNEEPVDYPDFAFNVADAISKKRFERGILICGTGIGMSIVANKFPRVRTALCHNVKTARLSRKHNDSNVLALGARVIDHKLAKKIVSTWLTTGFVGGRHAKRLKKIKKLEKIIFCK